MGSKMITKAILEEGKRLELARRAPPLNAAGHSVQFDKADTDWQNWLRLYGFLLLEYCHRDFMDDR